MNNNNIRDLFIHSGNGVYDHVTSLDNYGIANDIPIETIRKRVKRHNLRPLGRLSNISVYRNNDLDAMFIDYAPRYKSRK